MFRLILVLLFWGYLAWWGIRLLSRIAQSFRPPRQNQNPLHQPNSDPLLKAKKADVIDVN